MPPLFVLEVPTSVAAHVRNLSAAHPVARIKALAGLRVQLDAALDAAVAEARAMSPKPASWSEIAKAAGVRTSSAHERWRKGKKAGKPDRKI
jgi:hypothetical protein